MSGLAFYAIKALAIASVCTVWFIVLCVFSYALSKVIPDDPAESPEMSALYILAYIALASIAFWVVRTQVKHIPKMLNGVAGFDGERLKEASGAGPLAGLGLLFMLSPLTDRAMRVRSWLDRKLAK